MSDLKDRVTEGLKKVQLANLATITTEGLPWTRYVMISGDDDLTLRSATLIGARKVEQIGKTPEVHLTCGVPDPMEMKPYYQIQGTAEVVSDEAARHAFWNPTLEPIFDGPDDPTYVVVVIKPYRIERCTPPNMMSEVLELGEVLVE